MARVHGPPGPWGMASARHPCAHLGGRDLVLEAQVKHCLEAETPVLRLFNPGPEGVAHVADCVKRRRCAHIVAIEIQVSFDELAKPIGDRGATSLRAVLRACPALQRLDLRRNDLGDGAARTLVSAVEDSTALRWLDLSGNHFSTDGARQLLLVCHARGGLHLRGVPVPHDVLPLWLATRTPELELINFGDRDVRWLQDRLAAADVGHVEALRLEGSHERFLGPAGVASVLGVLAVCQSLKALHLNFHGLSAEGVSKMAEPLAQFPELRTLSLSDNDLGADSEGSADALGLLLGKCPSVETLDLCGNGLDETGFAERLLPQLLAQPPPRLDTLAGVELARGASSLQALERAGLLTRDPQRRLNIHILEAARSFGAGGRRARAE